jgi:hypothetical protein
VLFLNQTTSKRRVLKSVLLFALLHYAVWQCVGFAIFLLSHLPPKVVSLDPAILVLVQIENVLVAFRKFLLWLWPTEGTPGGLGLALTVINSLLWGVMAVAVRRLWQKLTV